MGLKEEFVELMCLSGMLRFGDFVTKAGRQSPYFINAGDVCEGVYIRRIGQLYARAIREFMPDLPQHLYGPAYKGIPLCNVTAYALAEMGFPHYQVTYNRKELKDHGEGGRYVGAKLSPGAKVVVIEDVLSRGTSVSDSIAALAKEGVKISGLVVGVDRMEKGYETKMASQEIADKHGIQVRSIVTMREIIDILSHEDRTDERFLLDASTRAKIETYLARWSAG